MGGKLDLHHFEQVAVKDRLMRSGVNLAPVLLASGQISMRKVDGWQTLAQKPVEPSIDLAA
jgi:hypothetical protein